MTEIDFFFYQKTAFLPIFVILDHFWSFLGDLVGGSIFWTFCRKSGKLPGKGYFGQEMANCDPLLRQKIWRRSRGAHAGARGEGVDPPC